jgi:hypothetical protein
MLIVVDESIVTVWRRTCQETDVKHERWAMKGAENEWIVSSSALDLRWDVSRILVVDLVKNALLWCLDFFVKVSHMRRNL